VADACGARIVSVLEGGYSLAPTGPRNRRGAGLGGDGGLAKGARAHVGALLGMSLGGAAGEPVVEAAGAGAGVEC